MSRPLTSLVIACVFFGLGWFGRDYAARESEPLPPVFAGGSAGSHETTAPPDASPPGRRAVAAGPVRHPPTLDRFQRLLDESAYDRAVQLLDETGDSDAAEGEALREALLAWLRAAMAAGNRDGFMGLVDSHLALYYDDIDVLMLLAEYQRLHGYIDEGARALHMAYTYAYSPLQKERVLAAVGALVDGVDAVYARQQRWHELLGFYQQLATIELARPGHRLRQAEILLQLGDIERANALLLALESDPLVGDEARRLLRVLPDQSTPGSELLAVEALPLIRRGNHYLIEVELNSVSRVSLIVDTGASISSLGIDSFGELLRHSDYWPLGAQSFSTAGGVVTAEVFRAAQLRIGANRLADVPLAVMDLQAGDDVDGLLGMDVLQHFRFEIDQEAALLYLRAR